MKEKREKRQRAIDAIFKVYNGSAVAYTPSSSSNKSVAKICSSGATIAKGTSISSLINEVRQ
ncbi:MAG: hypothetical protein V1933_06890 [Candidatus Omnitrophota bacterium]